VAGGVLSTIQTWGATTALFADTNTAILDRGSFSAPAFTHLVKTLENERDQVFYITVAAYSEVVVLGESPSLGPTLTGWEQCKDRFVQTNPHPNPNTLVAHLLGTPEGRFLSFTGGHYSHCGARHLCHPLSALELL